MTTRAPAKDIVGVILAGGQARRMGAGDKALVELDGKTLLERTLERATPQVDELLINANGDPPRFAPFHRQILPDAIQGHLGPLAGILTGLEWMKANRPDARWLASFPCDTPFFPRDLVAQLERAAAEAGHRQRSETRIAVGFQKPGPAGTVDFFGVPVEPAEGACERWIVDEADLAVHEAAVGRAAAECDLVVVYLHNHHWPADWMVPPGWMREVAARLLRAGGDVFLSHGAPVLQGLELIDGKPAAYGLGNFIFHSGNRQIGRAYV